MITRRALLASLVALTGCHRSKMPGPSYQTPSRSTFPFGRIPIVDKNGYPTQDYARYMTALEAKTNQTLSVQGNTVLNNLVQAVPTTVSPTTNTSAPLVFPEMSVTVITKGNPVLVLFAAPVSNDSGATTQAWMELDGNIEVNSHTLFDSPSANSIGMVSINYMVVPIAGSHTFQIVWGTQGIGVSRGYNLARYLQVLELG